MNDFEMASDVLSHASDLTYGINYSPTRNAPSVCHSVFLCILDTISPHDLSSSFTQNACSNHLRINRNGSTMVNRAPTGLPWEWRSKTLVVWGWFHAFFLCSLGGQVWWFFVNRWLVRLEVPIQCDDFTQWNGEKRRADRQHRWIDYFNRMSH